MTSSSTIYLFTYLFLLTLIVSLCPLGCSEGLCQSHQPMQQQFPSFQAGKSWFLFVGIIPTLIWSFFISLGPGLPAVCAGAEGSLTCALPSFPIPIAGKFSVYRNLCQCLQNHSRRVHFFYAIRILFLFLSLNITQQCQNEVSGSAQGSG